MERIINWSFCINISKKEGKRYKKLNSNKYKMMRKKEVVIIKRKGHNNNQQSK